MRGGAITALALLWGCASPRASSSGPPIPAPSDPSLADELLAGDGLVEVDLTLDLAWYFSDEERPSRARLDVDGRAAAVELERIGHASAFLCRYKKLRLVFTGAPSRTLFLSTHCNDVETASSMLQSELQLEGHLLAHRLRAALELPGLSVRGASLCFAAPGAGCQTERKPAFFTENAGDRAAALGGTLQGFDDAGPARSVTALDPRAHAELHLFQILINNRDWRLFELLPLGRYFLEKEPSHGLHNVFVIHLPGRAAVPIPLDLDASSFASLPSPIAAVTGGEDDVLLEKLAAPTFLPGSPPLVRWLVLRLVHFERSHPPQVAREAITRFRSAEQDLRRLVRDSGLSDPAIENAKLHLDAFFSALDEAAKLHVTRKELSLYSSAEGSEPSCRLPPGVPLRIAAPSAGRVEVELAQRLVIDRGPRRSICGDTLRGFVDAQEIDHE